MVSVVPLFERVLVGQEFVGAGEEELVVGWRAAVEAGGSLFDGHDASIHIFRRIAQASGAEVIHLGHNRSVREIVDAAIEEDAQGIAVTSYQGGHNEFFRYMHDMLAERGAPHNVRRLRPSAAEQGLLFTQFNAKLRKRSI